MALSTNFTYEYNGLTFGAVTSGIAVTKIDWSMPPITVNSQPRTRLDGSYPGLDLAQPRPIMIDFVIVNVGDNNYYTNRETWRRTFVLQPTTPQPLGILIPDWSTERRFYCRPRKVSMPEDPLSDTSISTWTVQLDADDPLLYSDTQHSVAAASSISVPNAGDYPSGAGTTAGVATITVSAASTVTGPSGGSITLTGTGPWTLDLGTHIVTGGNGYRDITQPAVWFTIPPGGATVSVSAGTVSALVRDAWLP